MKQYAMVSKYNAKGYQKGEVVDIHASWHKAAFHHLTKSLNLSVVESPEGAVVGSLLNNNWITGKVSIRHGESA